MTAQIKADQTYDNPSKTRENDVLIYKVRELLKTKP
jgi:hypothetical protein